MEKVADWQLANPSKHKATDWTQGAGYAGIMALVALSEDSKYLDAMVAMGEGNQWQLGPKPYFADDHCVGQTYAELYFKYRDPKMLGPLKESFDRILANPRDNPLDFKTPGNQDRWSWCDSLFMAPPAWLRLYRATGNPAYLDFMVREWWVTSDYLYDKDEHLYHRDSTYFDKREKNGKKVFWGRGNGWVMGGLVRVLQHLPDNHPARARFVEQYQQMSAKLLACQQSDGMWRASLLDPASYPLKETSSTGFYTYALAWGVNLGLLDAAKYRPAVLKAWASLVECVAADGKLTHVQPIGADPQKFPDDATEIYGVGAFLLAGSELHRMGVLEKATPRVIVVRNPAAFHRFDETVEVDLPDGVALPMVMDDLTSGIVDSQCVGKQLLFKVDLAPGESRRYLVMAATQLPGAPKPLARTFCRFVPERMDDFAWESDRIAHRMYGPALITGEGTVSSGIDVWVKRTRKLVIDRWYQSGDYHKDSGEGLDGYKVGPTRGCGGLGLWDGKQLHVSSNFRTYKVLANGPIRSSFELSYDSWDAGGRKVSEVKRVSIDAGSHFSRIESVFSVDSDKASALQVGIGIANRAGQEVKADKEAKERKPQMGGKPNPSGKGARFRSDADHQWMAYWEPESGKNGSTGCAVIVPEVLKSFAQDPANFLAVAEVMPDKPLVYQIGAGWSGSGEFANADDWYMVVHRERRRLANPLNVEVR